MVEAQTDPVRVLFIEDMPHEAELALIHLKRAGIPCQPLRVETEEAMRQALREFEPDLILSDFSLPTFDGMAALGIAHEVAPQIPFIFVSGTIGEERAIQALLCGAVDYVLKSNLARLGPAVRRALAEVAARRERQQQEAQIARLDRVLRMMSGVNSLVVRIRDRAELMQETCRLAISVGGYTNAIVSTISPGSFGLQPAAWSGVEESATKALSEAITESSTRESGMIAQVMRTGEPFVCNDTSNLEATTQFSSIMLAAGLYSVVALPLVIDNSVIGTLVLTARDSGTVSDEELRMLREVSGNLSFALQYLQQDTRVRFLSHFDPQTGLAKRSLFCDRLTRMLNTPEGRRGRFSVFVLDIERLSLINDSFGRRTGDLLLQHVSERLKNRFPQTERLAHLGGGTFAVVSNRDSRTLDETVSLARQYASSLFGEPFVIEHREIPVAARCGFALYPEHGKDAGTLVQNAEAALRSARALGERQLHFSPQHHSEMLGRLALEHKLRLAIERQQFELHYQPKVNIATRKIEGIEALVRWRDPDNGLVSPAAFLPLLESTGMIVDVGNWVIEQAARDCQRWLRAGLPPVRIAVNIAPMQLRLSSFVADFLRATRGWSTEVCGLDIEITEGALDEDSAPEIRKLRLLRSAGVKIAIDDFGTGYSSLSRLSSLPIDTLKIDRSFVTTLPQDPGRVLVKTIISLARAFDMTTVAEGVERQEQLDFLWHAGCDHSQGFLHSKPVAADALVSLLERGPVPLSSGVLPQPCP